METYEYATKFYKLPYYWEKLNKKSYIISKKQLTKEYNSLVEHTLNIVIKYNHTSVFNKNSEEYKQEQIWIDAYVRRNPKLTLFKSYLHERYNDYEKNLKHVKLIKKHINITINKPLTVYNLMRLIKLYNFIYKKINQYRIYYLTYRKLW